MAEDQEREDVKEYLGIDSARAKAIQEFIVKAFSGERSLTDVFKTIEGNQDFAEKEKLYAYFASGSYITYKNLLQIFNQAASIMKAVQEGQETPGKPLN